MLSILITLILLYLLCTRCRGSHPGWPELQDWSYAHRGLHDSRLPENSLAAFRAAMENGYGIELDLHLTKDGNLAVIHDSLLNRTTGQAGRVEDLTTEELSQYHLGDTPETIPTFSDVLNLIQGKVPLIVELKPVDGNHDQLAQIACKQLEQYQGCFCMESFDYRCLVWLRRHRPDIIRGQLAENFFATRNDLPDYVRFVATHCLTNFLCVPDFLAYRFDHRMKTPTCQVASRLWRAKTVAWTLRSREDFDRAKAEGFIPIFENFRP